MVDTSEDQNEQVEIEISVVVPVYRGRETLDELCNRTVNFFVGRGMSFEIILIDDGSSDGSWEKVLEISRRIPEVIGFRLMRNFGQHNATNCGFAHARGEFVVTIDEDLQNNPEDIEKLLDKQQVDDADVVYGIPIRRSQPLYHRIVGHLILYIPRLVMKTKSGISSFRLVRGSVAEVVAVATRPDLFIDIYLGWATDRIMETQVEHLPSRKTGYKLKVRVSQIFNILFNYSILPLRFSTVLGAVTALFSFLAGLIHIIMKLFFTRPVPGYTAIIVTIFFATGIILTAIGIVSEYLARIFLHINRKPQWIIREETDYDEEGSEIPLEASNAESVVVRDSGGFS